MYSVPTALVPLLVAVEMNAGYNFATGLAEVARSCGLVVVCAILSTFNGDLLDRLEWWWQVCNTCYYVGHVQIVKWDGVGVVAECEVKGT